MILNALTRISHQFCTLPYSLYVIFFEVLLNFFLKFLTYLRISFISSLRVCKSPSMLYFSKYLLFTVHDSFNVFSSPRLVVGVDFATLCLDTVIHSKFYILHN